MGHFRPIYATWAPASPPSTSLLLFFDHILRSGEGVRAGTSRSRLTCSHTPTGVHSPTLAGVISFTHEISHLLARFILWPVWSLFLVPTVYHWYRWDSHRLWAINVVSFPFSSQSSYWPTKVALTDWSLVPKSLPSFLTFPLPTKSFVFNH